jgi:hypothetical protein
MTKPKIQGGIGFRDLRIFNQALLAKQAWRLLEHPESLCARLLKAKYYPAGELLDTVFPKNASPCWQGITFGVELLKQGMIWGELTLDQESEYEETIGCREET